MVREDEAASWVHHGITLMTSNTEESMIQFIIDGKEAASTQTLAASIPPISSLTIGGNFQGSLKFLRLYEGMVGLETFTNYASCTSLSLRHATLVSFRRIRRRSSLLSLSPLLCRLHRRGRACLRFLLSLCGATEGRRVPSCMWGV